MIYDCFTFFDELDLLEIRLHELDSVVDRFVIVEATRTFSGLDKPLHYQRSRARYRQFAGKIIHVVVDDMDAAIDYRLLPCYPADPSQRAHIDRSISAWSREAHQRNAILRGLGSCRPEDVILIGDADEIPRATALTSLAGLEGLRAFRQQLHYYYLNCRAASEWLGTRAVRFGELLRTDPQQVRLAPAAEIVEDGGWHFSYLGGVDAVRRKIASFSHQELNTPELNEARSLLFNIENDLDIYGRSDTYHLVDLDSSYPQHVRRHRFRFRRLIRRDRHADRNTLWLREQIVHLRRENDALRRRLSGD